MKNLIFLVLGFFIVQACNAQNSQKTDWISDLDFIAKELPERHFNLFAVKSKEYFTHRLEEIKSSSGQLNDFDNALQLQQLIASMGDSHTSVNLRPVVDRKKILPLQLYWFKDGIYILRTSAENEDILGNQLLSINQIPIQTVIDSLSSLVTADNQAIVKSSIPKILPLVQALEYFDFVNDQKIELGVQDLKGNKKSHLIKPAELNRKNIKMIMPDSVALCYKNQKALFVDYYLPEDGIYYIQYNKCWSKELELKYNNGKNADKLPSFSDFEERVFGKLKTESIEKVVFDLRFNGGGSSPQGTAFIEKFAKYAKDNPEKQIFVILGRQTFSSAIINSMDFKRLTNAKFVGEQTSGKPNHFGEVKHFKLPNSGLQVGYSTKFFKRTDENMDSLIPDIEIEADFIEFKKGIDPAYVWIKEQ